MVMTVPAFYERYEDYIDGSLVFIYNKAKELYLRFELRAYPEKMKLDWDSCLFVFTSLFFFLISRFCGKKGRKNVCF